MSSFVLHDTKQTENTMRELLMETGIKKQDIPAIHTETVQTSLCLQRKDMPPPHTKPAQDMGKKDQQKEHEPKEKGCTRQKQRAGPLREGMGHGSRSGCRE